VDDPSDLITRVDCLRAESPSTAGAFWPGDNTAYTMRNPYASGNRTDRAIERSRIRMAERETHGKHDRICSLHNLFTCALFNNLAIVAGGRKTLQLRWTSIAFWMSPASNWARKICSPDVPSSLENDAISNLPTATRLRAFPRSSACFDIRRKQGGLQSCSNLQRYRTILAIKPMVPRTSYARHLQYIHAWTTHAQQTRHEALVKCSYDARISRRCCANVMRMLCALHMRDIPSSKCDVKRAGCAHYTPCTTGSPLLFSLINSF
jgi:hypothetical protein